MVKSLKLRNWRTRKICAFDSLGFKFGSAWNSMVIEEYNQDVHLVEIDIEEDQEIAEAAGIIGTPCVQFFKNKEMLRTVSGVKMKKQYKEFIEANK